MEPTATRVAVLVNPADPLRTKSTVTDVGTAARVLGLQVQVLNASTIREIDSAFTGLARERPDAHSRPSTSQVSNISLEVREDYLRDYNREASIWQILELDPLVL